MRARGAHRQKKIRKTPHGKFGKGVKWWSKVNAMDRSPAMENSPIKSAERKVLLRAALTDNANHREIFTKGRILTSGSQLCDLNRVDR